MGRKQSATSQLLDICMDVSSVLMGTSDKHKQREMIDKLDDERRQKKRRKEEEYLSKLKNNLNGIKSLFELVPSKFVIEENELLKEQEKTLKEYEHFLLLENEKEDYFEQLDDENLEELKEKIENFIEKSRKNNEIVQEEIIKDRFKK